MNEVIKNSIETVNRLKFELRTEVEEAKPLLTDKDLSIEDRWSLFESIQDFLPESSWELTFPTLFKHRIEYYHHLHYERYETVDLVSIFERWRISELPEDEQNSLKEEILEEGYGYFKYDW